MRRGDVLVVWSVSTDWLTGLSFFWQWSGPSAWPFGQSAGEFSTSRPTSYNMDATSADCPKAGETEVKRGNTFSCTITIDGEDKSVTITVKVDQGMYEVGLPD